ncbi:hypothetical protein SteCoe_37342 [Stentor coeruleus]|uniref:Phosphorylated adapter RNA export protein n=1 Tax=Stentor coeruleus TaxID=5963 RepID=A0A1R2ANB4_9CILI|nr:hypothetical protein SteCoe_37342 [Stentor coeruleus]
MDLSDQQLDDVLLVKKVSEILQEKEIDLIHSVINVMGKDFCIQTMKKVQDIQEQGGLDKKNGGKRTPGGVFFCLVRDNCTKEENAKIFKKQNIEKRRRYVARKKIMLKLAKLDLV